MYLASIDVLMSAEDDWKFLTSGNMASASIEFEVTTIPGRSKRVLKTRTNLVWAKVAASE